MAVTPFNKFNSFVEALAEKQHDLQNDSFKVMLTNVAPVAGNTQKSDITEIAAGNGYTAGGNAAVVSASAQSAGLFQWTLADVLFTATADSIATFRYAVLYNDTHASKLLVGWYDYLTGVVLLNGEVFTVDFDATLGAARLQ
jgi:hypothetical protein